MAKKPDPAPTVPAPTVQIVVTGPHGGRWRGRFGTARHFTPDPQSFSDLDLMPEEIVELQEDPELTVVITDIVPITVGVDLGRTDPAPVDAAPAEPAATDAPTPEAPPAP